MIVNGYLASIFWFSCVCGYAATVPTVEERAKAGDGRGAAPRVGLIALEACTSSTTDDACMQNIEIVSALDSDEYLSVTAYEKGVLDCDSLEKAEDAPELRFILNNSEEVIAKRKSFTVKSADAFSNNIKRMVWTGEVIEMERVFGGIPRSIAMSWSNCDVETFVLKVKTPQHDGTTRATMTLPCTGPSEPQQVCLLQIDHAAEEEAFETLVDGEEEETRQERQTRENQYQGQKGQEDDDEMGVVASSDLSRVPFHQRAKQGEEEDGNDDNDDDNNPRRKRRHLRKTADGADEGSSSSSGDSGDGSDSSSGSYHVQASTSRRGTRRSRSRTTEVHRRLAREVSKGMEAARARDPDVDAKDEDVRLLSEYLQASQPEQEAFHGRGVRRLSSAEVQMPSGRILAASTDIDVMVLYTDASLVTSSGNAVLMTEEQMETEITTYYAEANDALADSGISATVNVVHMAKVAFVESSDMNSDLASIAAGKGKAAGFDAMRSKYGADLVQMIGFYADSCGTGYVMAVPRAAFGTYAYSIVHVHCLMNLSHIHELGHNMGANHNRESSATSHDYAHAQRYCSGDAPYRTIMAYETGCLAAPRVPMFSAQGKTYAGRSLGTEESDNARIIRESLATVVNFRDQVVVPAPSPSPQQTETLSGAPDLVPAAVPDVTATTASDREVRRSGPVAAAGTPASSVGVPSAVTIYPDAGDAQQMIRVGCFKDDENDSVMEQDAKMPAIEAKTAGMTRKNCMAYCIRGSPTFKYFGVEDGKTCFCWPDSSTLQRLGRLTEDDCKMKCAGDSTATCGGNASIEVFEIENASPEHQQERQQEQQPEGTLITPTSAEDSSSNSTFQACYHHSWSDFQLGNIPIIDYTNTSRSTCRAHCKAAGFVYYALEFGFMCSCGDRLPDKASAATSTYCSLPCTNSLTTHTCGGNWHQAVFLNDGKQ